MPTKKVTSTVNIKPPGTTAHNVVPKGNATVQYGAYLTPDNSWRYGAFKYGAKKYGSSVESSLGQTMPKVSTTEV